MTCDTLHVIISHHGGGNKVMSLPFKKDFIKVSVWLHGTSVIKHDLIFCLAACSRINTPRSHRLANISEHPKNNREPLKIPVRGIMNKFVTDNSVTETLLSVWAAWCYVYFKFLLSDGGFLFVGLPLLGYKFCCFLPIKSSPYIECSLFFFLIKNYVTGLVR